MAAIVVIENARITITSPKMLPSDAGYNNTGINGSHGPKIKIINNIQGVILDEREVSCTCLCYHA